ncbi:MAG: NAD-dependent DNA ligase LigA, partial [Acidobacteria bacterium]|nr:NAD-dependent DNA ligase LigA [Acidobacteriota bacterium]
HHHHRHLVFLVEGIGTVKATFLHEGIQDNRVVLETLASHGVNMGAEPEATSGEKVLGGLSVCVTGSVKSAPSLASLSRTGVQELIEANGGKAASSVSASTSLLVCGEPGSSKWQKATDLGIRIVTPVEFAEMLSL